MDLFPTLLGLAGVAPPVTAADPLGAHGGRDLGPLLRNEETAPALAAALDARTFYFHSARMGCPTPEHLSSQVVEEIADGRYKLVAERYDEPRLLLYDLQEDPGEQRPMVAGPLVEQMGRRLEEVREAAGAPG